MLVWHLTNKALLIQDEENLQRAHNEVPSDDELNCRLARSSAELATFRAIDAEMDATNAPMGRSCPHKHFAAAHGCLLASCIHAQLARCTHESSMLA